MASKNTAKEQHIKYAIQSQ